MARLEVNMNVILVLQLIISLALAAVQNQTDEVNVEASDSKKIGEPRCPDNAGKLQSPIALGNIPTVEKNQDENEVEDDDGEEEAPPPIQSVHKNQNNATTEFFGNKYYGKTRDRFYAHNDGDTYYFQFHPTEPTSEMTVRSEGWDDEYVFAKGRFHWGVNSTNGSEHWIHGESYPMELQLMHYRKGDKNLQEARKKKDGVLILSILYGVDEERSNPALNPLIQGAASVYFPGPMKQIHGPVRLKALLPLQMNYFEYTGSFTSPPCDEGVKWVVFEEPQIMSTPQLEILKKLVFKDGEQMMDNFRSLQPRHGREIKYSGPAVLKMKMQTSLSLALPILKVSKSVTLISFLCVFSSNVFLHL